MTVLGWALDKIFNTTFLARRISGFSMASTKEKRTVDIDTKPGIRGMKQYIFEFQSRPIEPNKILRFVRTD